MRSINLSKLSPTECAGIQINGLSHCKKINCKWQGLTACEGREIIKTHKNALGFQIGEYGFIDIKSVRH